MYTFLSQTSLEIIHQAYHSQLKSILQVNQQVEALCGFQAYTHVTKTQDLLLEDLRRLKNLVSELPLSAIGICPLQTTIDAIEGRNIIAFHAK